MSFIIKKIISTLSATAFVATSLNISAISQINACNAPVAKHENVHCIDCYEEHYHKCSLENCDDSIDNNGEGISIALLDTGVSDYETALNISFIDDNTVDSEHGNNMMSTIMSIAPGADVFDVRVLDDNGIGTNETVEKGIRWAVDNKADIIVMSFAGEDKSSLIENALLYAEENNVLVVASAGNNSSSDEYYPAAYPSVISVGATDENGIIQTFSNYGDSVDTYAQSDDGTSSAAQITASTVACLMQNDSDITVSEIREIFNIKNDTVFTLSEDQNADSLVYACATCTKHDYSVLKQIAKPNTCTSNGAAIYKCSRCSSTTTKTTYALGHNWSSWSKYSSATCTSPEIQSRKCSRCYTVEKKQVGSALGHNYSNLKQIAKNNTCTENGAAIYQCSRCSSTTTKTTYAYGHNWSSWNIQPATCTSPEIQSRKCSNCYTVEKKQVGSALGHDLKSEILASPTTTSSGVSRTMCKRSGCDYCVVNIIPQITTLTVDDYGFSKFDYHADGTLDTATCSWPLHGTIGNNNYLRLNVKSNVKWTISTDKNFVHIVNSSGSAISGGNNGETYVYFKLDYFPFDSNENSRNATITIKANDKTKTYSLVQYNRSFNGMNKKEYLDEVSDFISLVNNSNYATSRDAKLLRGELLTHGSTEVIQTDTTMFIAISSYYAGESDNEIVIEYLQFIAAKGPEGDSLNSQIRVVRTNNLGMKIARNSSPMFECSVLITEDFINAHDPKHEKIVGYSKLAKVPMKAASEKLEFENPLFGYVADYTTDALLDLIGNWAVNLIHANKGNDGYYHTKYGFSMQEDCILNKPGNFVQIHSSNKRDTSTQDVTLNFDIVNSRGLRRRFTY